MTKWGLQIQIAMNVAGAHDLFAHLCSFPEHPAVSICSILPKEPRDDETTLQQAFSLWPIWITYKWNTI